MSEDSSLFRAVGTKDRLVDRVVKEIQGAIVERRLVPGTRLPPERELAEQVGVSRTVVREAVHILVTKGLLEARQGVGTVVREVSAEQVAESLSILVQTQRISLDELHHVRSILEVEIAGLAAQHATGEDIAELKSILDAMEAAAQEPEPFGETDGDFHQALARISQNALMVVLLGSIRDVMQAVRLRVYRYPRLYQIVMPDHYRIMERVMAGDVGGAREAMREHLEHARRVQEEVQAQQ